MKLRFEGVEVEMGNTWVEVRREGDRFRPVLCSDSPTWEPILGPRSYSSYDIALERGETALKYAIGKLAETCN